MKKDYKNILVYIFFLISIFISLFISVLFTFKSSNNEVNNILSYMIQGGYNYTVHYKDNKFYNDSTYNSNSNILLPSKLIDSIDFNFDYHINYNDLVTGNIIYSINSKLIVENNLNKEIILESNLNDNYKSKSYDLEHSITIDYEYYKNLYNEYLNELGDSYKGNAYISLEFNISNSNSYHSIKSSDRNIIIAKIPISEDPIEITKYTDITSDIKILKDIKNNSEFNNFYRISSIFLWIVSILLIYSLSLYHNKSISESSTFNIKLSKILREYDSIIVEVKRLPHLESYKVIETTTFNELLDAQNALEMPINYKFDKGIAKFVIVKDDLAYVYYLKDNKKV